MRILTHGLSFFRDAERMFAIQRRESSEDGEGSVGDGDPTVFKHDKDTIYVCAEEVCARLVGVCHKLEGE
jgi:hypothetical protein